MPVTVAWTTTLVKIVSGLIGTVTATWSTRTATIGAPWVQGNLLPPQNLDHYSTFAAPLDVPPYAQVTTWDAADLPDAILPWVGMLHRDTEEQNLLDETAAAF